jgi:hypothetical protein
MLRTEPLLVKLDGTATEKGSHLPRAHTVFDERFLQELLAGHPELLPVTALREDAGVLVCIGREVPTRTGPIDNLYLSTSGYVVVVETKLWRNPQSRREVFAQILDYVKDVATRDFDWLSRVWDQRSRELGREPEPLLEVMHKAAGEAFEGDDFVDRVQRALDRGQVIALIVGDGIETRLQDLVSYVCRDSAHLRYALGLVSLHCYRLPGSNDLLVLPELVREVVPVERAYVRIEIGESLEGRVQITSEALKDDPASRPATRKRVSLTEDDFYESLRLSIGPERTEQVRRFIDSVAELGVEPEYKAAAVMLKIAAPDGESPGASLLAIERSGRIYNNIHGWHQVNRWGWDLETVGRTIGEYWRELHRIDSRFSPEGIGHLQSRAFFPIIDVLPKTDAMLEATSSVVDRIQREAERRTHESL